MVWPPLSPPQLALPRQLERHWKQQSVCLQRTRFLFGTSCRPTSEFVSCKVSSPYPQSTHSRQDDQHKPGTHALDFSIHHAGLLQVHDIVHSIRFLIDRSHDIKFMLKEEAKGDNHATFPDRMVYRQSMNCSKTMPESTNMYSIRSNYQLKIARGRAGESANTHLPLAQEATSSMMASYLRTGMRNSVQLICTIYRDLSAFAQCRTIMRSNLREHYFRRGLVETMSMQLRTA